MGSCISAPIKGADSKFEKDGKDFSNSTTNLKSFAFSELKTATTNFHPANVLGEGRFGSVFKGWIDEHTFTAAKPGTGMVVVVKRLTNEDARPHKKWLEKINNLGQLHHPNLVKLVGYCLEDHQRFLVYEFMAQGSLEDLLFTRTWIQPPSWNLRVKVALGAAKGLAFLHSPEVKLICRDFKSSNILLDSNFNAKLDDFGLARRLDNYVGEVLPGPYGYDDPDYLVIWGTNDGYTAPEYVVTGHPTAESDVYSFGVVLLEMLTGRRAADKNGPIGKDKLVEWAKPYLANKHKILHLMDPRIEGQYSVGGALRAANIAIKCLATEPELRPNMNDVVEALEQLQDLKDTESPKTKSLHNNHYNSNSGLNVLMKLAKMAFPISLVVKECNFPSSCAPLL